MGSLARTAGAVGAVVLAGATLAMTQSPAQAAKRKQISVPCSAPALAAAITAANVTPTTLFLAANCTYNITTAATATDALPVITGNVRIVGGPSTTIRRDPAAGAVRIFEVAVGGTLRVDGIFILNGAPAAGVPGGGIQDAGSLTLNQVTLSGNVATGANGGGLNIAATGNALVNRTVVSGNTASGVGAGGGINNSGILTINESRVSFNNAGTGGGGGLATQLGATSQIIQSTFDHNTTTGNGGGIFNAGTTTLNRTLVELNAATLNGGGIFNVPPGTVTLVTSTIRNNTPNNCFPLGTIPGCVG
jgi:hypothetical protein